MRFHVLGIGSIGTLVAHHLRVAQPNATVCLLTRSAKAFHQSRQTRDGIPLPSLHVTRQGGDSEHSEGYELDVTEPGQFKGLTESLNAEYGNDSPALNAGAPIERLIVCTKAVSTAEAIAKVQSRITPSSVIALLQNGMGVYDELCAKFWPEPSARPNFILGTTTHGVTPGVRPGVIQHMSRPGQGSVKWGVVPDPRGKVDYEKWLWGKSVNQLPALAPPDSPKLPLPPAPAGVGMDNLSSTLTALLSMSALAPSLLPMPHLYHELLLKLAVNATINPLTAVLGAGYLANGALHRSGPGNRLIQMTSKETSHVLTAYLHNLAGAQPAPPDTLRLFSPDSIIGRVNEVIAATRDNFSSMAKDVQAGRLTEIDYINGYLVSLGNRLHVPTHQHKMLVQMVKFRAEVAGLGHTVYPSVTELIKDKEGDMLELRRLSLEERKVALKERELAVREDQAVASLREQRRINRQKRKERRQALHARVEAREAEAAAADATNSDAFSGSSSSSSNSGSG